MFNRIKDSAPQKILIRNLRAMYRRRIPKRSSSRIGAYAFVFTVACAVFFILVGLSAVSRPLVPFDLTRSHASTAQRSHFPKHLLINETFMKVHLLIGDEISRYFVQTKLPLWQRLPEGSAFFRFDSNTVTKQYSVMPEACGMMGSDTFAVIIVITRPDGLRYRKAVRETWGSLADRDCGIRLIFMIGRTTNSTIQNDIVAESTNYSDILQSTQFLDNYRSQSLKSLHAFQWVTAFCPASNYTIKIDDDNWLNLPRYLQYLRAQPPDPFIHGGIFRGGVPALRDPEEKNFVPREDYPPDEYPEYLTGMLYAVPTKYLGKIVYIGSRLNVGLNEDMFVNGIVAIAAGLERKNVEGYAWKVERDKCQKKEMCVHYSSVEDLYRMWNDRCAVYDKLC